MGVSSFGIVSGSTLTTDSATALHEPGTILTVKTGTDQWSLAEYVQLDNNGCSDGQVLVTNFATLKQYSVKLAATTDRGAPLRGIAAATIASQYFGWMYIGGFVGTAQLSLTAASGEYLQVSGSTAGTLTPEKASVFNAGTQGNTSMFMAIAQARTAIATGLGSVSLMGIWG